MAPLRIQEDGSLSREKAERFVLLLAEGLGDNEAWAGAGGDNRGGSEIDARKQNLADPALQARLAVLLEQRRKDWFSGPHGEAMWGARTAMRLARLAGGPDAAAQVLRCAELMARIADKVAPSGEGAGGAPAETVQGRGPGRPASETKQSRADPGRIRSELLEKGFPAPPDPDAGGAVH